MRLKWPRLLPALLSAGLLYACHFPIAWGGLAWVALVPLLTLVRADASKKRIFFAAYACGVTFLLAAVQWMRLGDDMLYLTWVLLCVYCALYYPLAILIVRRLDRRLGLPLALTFPTVWAALEFCRCHLMTGFGWYLLGHTQHDFLAVAQLADLGGVHLVSVLVAAVNAALFEVLYPLSWFRAFFSLREPEYPLRRSPVVAQAATVLLLFAAALGYGGWRLSQNTFETGPRVALTQSNLDIRLKNEAWSEVPSAKSAADAMRVQQIRLTDAARSRGVDLIVWPETSWPERWVELRDDDGTRPIPEVLEWGRQLGERWRTPVLVGLSSVDLLPDRRALSHNSALLLDADGRPRGRYDKIHLVPFGEYLPLRDTFPFMTYFSPYDFDYSVTPGERLTRFAVGRWHFGVLICYEDTVDYLARRYPVASGDGPGVDFLLNTSNDGWFDGSAEHDEHLVLARFRAIEARRTVARAVNMGITAVVDPQGRVLPPRAAEPFEDIAVWEIPTDEPPTSLPLSRWSEFKKTSGVLVATLPIDRRVSLYTRWGDWLPWSCWVLVALGLTASSRRR